MLYSFNMIELYNPRMVWAGKDFEDPPVPTATYVIKDLKQHSSAVC